MMKKSFHILLIFLLLVSCAKEKVIVKSDLEKYIDSYQNLEKDYLIACAGGNNFSFMGNSETPISIFYYKIDGYQDVQIFESTNSCANDYSSYKKTDLLNENLFNGRMGRFLSAPISTPKWMVLAYVANNKIHISDPIKMNPISYPTIDISNQLIISEDSINPTFNWQNDNVSGNVIYFSLISDLENNFISGTYTQQKYWTFYDLSNVVLNVTPSAEPLLLHDTLYQYTHMGVDDDNWVRSMSSKSFNTH